MTTPLITWIIEPRDPLIVRDGRPFGNTPGAQAVSLAFPFPSTTTGGFRAHVWRQTGCKTDSQTIDELKQVQVHGPLLVELRDDDKLCWMAPAPVDALFFEGDDTSDLTKGIRKRLIPLDMPDGALTDLTSDNHTLHLVGMPEPDPRKPLKKPPRFWYWEKFENWLIAPEDGQACELAKIGHTGPEHEQRTHVALKADTQTAEEGRLFQTRGLEFTRGDTHTRLALAIAVEDTTEPHDGGLTPLGGERRMVMWRKSTQPLPGLPAGVLEQVQESRACRIILLTPAHLATGDQGWLPTWLQEERDGVCPTLKAVAMQRPLVVSGWDLAADNGKGKPRGKPKPTRRLAPAGSVFFLSLEGDDAAIERWVRAIWMHCISDDVQDRRDGFGLAVVGTWDGTPQHLKIQREE